MFVENIEFYLMRAVSRIIFARIVAGYPGIKTFYQDNLTILQNVLFVYYGCLI